MKCLTVKSETTDDLYSAAASSQVLRYTLFSPLRLNIIHLNTHTHCQTIQTVCLMTHFSLIWTQCTNMSKHKHTYNTLCALCTRTICIHMLVSPSQPHKHTTQTDTHTHTRANMPHTVSSGLIYNESQREGEREFSSPNSSQRFGDQSSTHTTTNTHRNTDWPQAPLHWQPTMHLTLWFTYTHNHKKYSAANYVTT